MYVPDSSDVESGSSVASSGTLFPSDMSSAQGFEDRPSGSRPLSTPAAPLVRHGTRLQHGISKSKVYIDGTVRYNLFFATSEPQNHHEALCLKNETRHFVPHKARTNIIDYKWVHKIKRKSDGSIDKYKAWLAAKGFKP
jgi:hypothetical protein